MASSEPAVLLESPSPGWTPFVAGGEEVVKVGWGESLSSLSEIEDGMGGSLGASGREQGRVCAWRCSSFELAGVSSGVFERVCCRCSLCELDGSSE